MDRLVFLIYRAIRALISPLSLATIFRIGAALGTVGYYLGGSYRKLALRNLEIAFPEKDDAARRQIARTHFSTLFGNLLCSLKIGGMKPEEILEIIEVDSREISDAAFALGKGGVFTLSHMGNWELLAQIMPLLYPGKLGGTVYQRLGNPYIEAETRANRSARGVILFERKEGFTGALKVLRENGMVGVLVDQHAGDAGFWCPFFGRLASTSTLAATLAHRAGSALVPMCVVTVAPGKWKLTALPAVQPEPRTVEGLTMAANAALEQQIRSNPPDWFWVHNRWKTPKPKFLLATYKRGVADVPSEQLQRFRVLIRSSNWLGDAVMSAPAVRAIKGGRPDLHLTILSPAKLADVWRQMPEVDEVIPFEKADGLLGVVRKVKGGRFDAAVLFPNSIRVALEAWLAGVPRIVGYPGHRRSWLVDQVLRPKRSKKAPEAKRPKHQVHHYLALADFIGAEIEGAHRGFVRHEKADLASPKPRIGICPGAEYGPAKRWLPERFAEVVQRWNEQRPSDWVMFGVTKDASIGEQIEQLAPGAIQNLIGKTSLQELMDEVRKCDVLLTNDTGTMHLAAFLGVPTVAIFGSTEHTLTGPIGQGHRIVRHHVSCSPCFLRECPLDFRCMNSVTVDEVLVALGETLQQHRTEPAPGLS